MNRSVRLAFRSYALRVPALALALAAGTLALPALAADEGFDERGANVFFTQPDNDTKKRIDALIDAIGSGGPRDRLRNRNALQRIGFWAVNPLVDAVEKLDPQVQCGCILTLEAIGDPRAIPQLRRTTIVETSHPLVAAFATLALGRYRDAASVPAMRTALDSPKSMSILRAAVPLALARVHTPEALALLEERLRDKRFDQDEIRGARFLALGFFPGSALAAGGPSPSAALEDGLTSSDKSDRQAAVIGYLVASLGRTDTKARLLQFLDKEDWQYATIPALLGLSSYPDEETTQYLVRTAQKHGKDNVQLYALDLLATRADPSALPGLLRLVRSPSYSMRARATLALSSIDSPEAAQQVVAQLDTSSALVRSTAAAASVRIKDPAQRALAAKIIDQRLRSGAESDRIVRMNLQLAASVLAGERTDVQWHRVSNSRILDDLSASYETRLLSLVNARANASLSLWKVSELSTDSELAGTGLPSGSDEDSTTDESNEDDGGGDDDAPPVIEGGEPSDDPNPSPGSGEPGGPAPSAGDSSGTPARFSGTPGVGQPRVNQHQELRDLKIRLLKSPYFTFEDLPGRRRPDVTDK